MKKVILTTGQVKDRRTVILDHIVPEPLERVRVVLEPLEAPATRPYMDVMAEIRLGQRARGHQPRTATEIDAYLKTERESWD